MRKGKQPRGGICRKTSHDVAIWGEAVRAYGGSAARVDLRASLMVAPEPTTTGARASACGGSAARAGLMLAPDPTITGACGGSAACVDLRAGLMLAPEPTTTGIRATCFKLMGKYLDAAIADLAMDMSTATLIVDLSNQRWFGDYMSFSNVTTKFTIPPIIIAARATILEIVPSRFVSMVHMVRDGNSLHNERRGIEEDPVVAESITMCTGPIVFVCGDGKVDEGEDGVIFRAVRAHLEAGHMMVIMARTGTCSGNYKRLQTVFPDLLRVVDHLIPE